ncbi:MAG: preprotein translocase subunit SecE [Sedimentisphaerales bacterium]|nr:preprotein translocase subunit SecE [Sedimentisphaerales bacterium]
MSMQIYKPGQGKYTRLISGVSVALIVAIGCWRLYERLAATDWSPWIVFLVPLVVFCVIGVGIYWLLNKQSVADFLIASEGELKKVNWSSKKEVAVSTFVVIVVVVLMAALLGATDMVFQLVFDKLLG